MLSHTDCGRQPLRWSPVIPTTWYSMISSPWVWNGLVTHYWFIEYGNCYGCRLWDQNLDAGSLSFSLFLSEWNQLLCCGLPSGKARMAWTRGRPLTNVQCKTESHSPIGFAELYPANSDASELISGFYLAFRWDWSSMWYLDCKLKATLIKRNPAKLWLES